MLTPVFQGPDHLWAHFHFHLCFCFLYFSGSVFLRLDVLNHGSIVCFYEAPSWSVVIEFRCISFTSHCFSNLGSALTLETRLTFLILFLNYGTLKLQGIDNGPLTHFLLHPYVSRHIFREPLFLYLPHLFGQLLSCHVLLELEIASSNINSVSMQLLFLKLELLQEDAVFLISCAPG